MHGAEVLQGLIVRATTADGETAALDFRQARERELDDVWLRYSQVLAHLAEGDTGGYQRGCAAMLARFDRSDHLADAQRVVRMCIAVPDAVPDAAPLVALAERAVSGGTEDSPNGPALTALGAALYRAGRLEAAVQSLTEASASTGGGGEVTGWLFLALAHARLGQAAEARQWLEKAATPGNKIRGRHRRGRRPSERMYHSLQEGVSPPTGKQERKPVSGPVDVVPRWSPRCRSLLTPPLASGCIAVAPQEITTAGFRLSSSLHPGSSRTTEMAGRFIVCAWLRERAACRHSASAGSRRIGQ
jgi:hypothetical protein